MGDPADPKSLAKSGLRETIDDISPIRDYSERLEVRLGEYTIGDPVVSERECREKDQSFEVPVNVKVSFTNLDTGEIREQTVFLGNFPWMTEQGTFIINGTERVVVTQLVRSPGAYIMEPKDATKQVFVANLMPSRGSWLEMEIDKKGLVNVRIDRKRKLPVTTLLRALPEERREHRLQDRQERRGPAGAVRGQPLHPHDAREGSVQARGRGPDRGLQEAAAGRAADARELAQPRAGALLRSQALRPDQGRPLQAEHAPRAERVARVPRAHHRRHRRAGAPARGAADQAARARGLEGLRRRHDRHPARRGRARPRRVRALRQPPPAHGGRADPGGLPDRPLPDGAGGARAPHDRGRGRDHPADDRQHPAGGRGAEGVLRLVAAVASSWIRPTRWRGSRTAAACRRSAPAA